jgi:hypothetical protein
VLAALTPGGLPGQYARERLGVRPLLLYLLPPPWAVLAAVLGIVHASVFYVLFGERLPQLPFALAFGLTGSVVGAFVGTIIPPAVLAIGDTNLIATAAAAWLVLLAGRLFRFC